MMFHWRRRRQLRTFARAADVYSGVLLERRFSGGVISGPFTHSVITLKFGSTQEVVRHLLTQAISVGYTDSPTAPMKDQHWAIMLREPSVLPRYTIEAFPAGSFVRGRGILVPTGWTAVCVTLR